MEDGGCFAHKMLRSGSRGITHYKVPKVEALPAHRAAEGKVTEGLVIELKDLGNILVHDNSSMAGSALYATRPYSANINPRS